MKNKDAIELAKQFLETGNSKAFETLWSSTVNMVNVNKYYDPTGARTQEDFLQITKIGLYQALNSFKEGKGSTLLTWIRMRMEQMLIKEVRKMAKTGWTTKLPISSAYTHSSTIGKDTGSKSGTGNLRNSSISCLIYEALVTDKDYQPASAELSEELYWQIVADISNRITNDQILRCFNLKLAFPHLSRNSISKLVKITKPTISHYFDTIRKCITVAAEKYAI